ncbi:trypco2 family protein [Pseudarthrobacter albicanus]|uniref:trypco2 family protein n=1 Tax=Pseudarthrobacter albicanus TaxID=2823873 RepID=UPI001BAC6162|nr:trypco2 family protein [Pseudarthrobacter albicanus]
METHRIELSTVIASLRAEISKAWWEGQYDTVGFEAGAIEVELTTEIEIVQIGGKLSAKFWVLTAEAEARRKRTDTQKINFSLTPKDRRDPSKPLVIAGQAAPGEHRPAVSQDENDAAGSAQHAAD